MEPLLAGAETPSRRRIVGAALLVGLLLLLFILDVLLPDIVLLPFMYVPVVAAASFAGPRVTSAIALLAMALGVLSGVIDNDFRDDDYWIRLAGLAAVALLAVYLARLEANRERQLAEGEARLRLMLDNTADVVLRTGADGTLLWASPSLRTVFGWDPETVVGTQFEMALQPDGAGTRAAFDAAIAASATEYDLKGQVICADGSQRWAEARSRIVHSPDGRVESVVSSIRDVTNQVQAEQQVASSELRFRLLAENSGDAVFLLDEAGIVVWASPATADQLGHALDDLVGRMRTDFVHFEDLRTVNDNWRRAGRGEHVMYEERFHLNSGEYRWVSVALGPFLDEGGTLVGYVAALRDVHDDVLLRDALRRNERMFRLAMDGAAEGMAVVGLHQRFLQVNAALCSLVGRDALWLLDHDEDDLLHPDDVEPTREVRDRLLAGRADHETRTTRLITADGGVVLVAHAQGLLRDQDGLPLFFVCQYYALAEERLPGSA